MKPQLDLPAIACIAGLLRPVFGPVSVLQASAVSADEPFRRVEEARVFVHFDRIPQPCQGLEYLQAAQRHGIAIRTGLWSYTAGRTPIFFGRRPGNGACSGAPTGAEHSKDIVRRMLRHHLRTPGSPLKCITTDMIDMPGYGGSVKYLLYE